MLSRVYTHVNDTKKAGQNLGGGNKSTTNPGVVTIRSMNDNIFEPNTPNDELMTFFAKIIAAFEQINFYNVLVLDYGNK
jgi:hypothetical protein